MGEKIKRREIERMRDILKHVNGHLLFMIILLTVAVAVGLYYLGNLIYDYNNKFDGYEERCIKSHEEIKYTMFVTQNECVNTLYPNRTSDCYFTGGEGLICVFNVPDCVNNYPFIHEEVVVVCDEVALVKNLDDNGFGFVIPRPPMDVNSWVLNDIYE